MASAIYAGDGDTIAAIATAPGEGGIAMVRISGPGAEGVLSGLFRPAKPRDRFESRRLTYGRAVDEGGAALDEVMAALMRAPGTYTREDVAEIYCHGGRACASAVLSRALALGARMARPGEFTKRAFLNGRVDLARAEAVMQLVGANGQAAARASLRQLEGGVSGFVRGVCERLKDLMALLEASTDFPEEIEEEAAAGRVVTGLRGVIDELDRHADARRARMVREGASIVLAGKPNVGKSSLMNALLEQDRAIVTDIPGTTRDVLTEKLMIGGIVAELSDTAGRRATADPIEKLGVDRAERAAQGADVVLVVVDASEPPDDADAALLAAADDRTVVCLNKTDLEPVVTAGQLKAATDAPVIEVSARTGEGIPALLKALEARVAVDGESSGLMTAGRHIELAHAAAGRLEEAIGAIESGMPLDIASIDIRAALDALTEITGENATEAVIERVFENFCVGK